MKIKLPLLFGMILLLFPGCRKEREPNEVNEINVGLIGAKISPPNKLSFKPIFQIYFNINLNTNRLLVIKSPTFNNPEQKHDVRGKAFNFSTNRIISNFINTALKTESITTIDLRRKTHMEEIGPAPKILYFEFNRGSLHRQYIVDLKNANPSLRALYDLLFSLSKSETNSIVTSQRINEDSLIAPISRNIEFILDPPPPPVPPTIKYVPPSKRKKKNN